MSGGPLGYLDPTSRLFPRYWFPGENHRAEGRPFHGPVCRLACPLLSGGDGSEGAGTRLEDLKCPEVSEETPFCPAQRRELERVTKPGAESCLGGVPSGSEGCRQRVEGCILGPRE